jgi:hypothetical protein
MTVMMSDNSTRWRPGENGQMTTNPASQYATDRNLRARQGLWERQEPAFDVVSWALELADVTRGVRVNGRYLTAMRSLGVEAVGCDLSIGMLKLRRITPWWPLTPSPCTSKRGSSMSCWPLTCSTTLTTGWRVALQEGPFLRCPDPEALQVCRQARL